MGLPGTYAFTAIRLLLLMGFKLMAGAVASCALIGVAVGVGIIYGSLLISIGRNPYLWCNSEKPCSWVGIVT